MSDYNGWVNRATWAMALNLGNEESVYRDCEKLARYVAIGNEDNEDGFHEELAHDLMQYAKAVLHFSPELLPDFDPEGHESSDPRDNNGPDDYEEVNWREIADGYELKDYV